eukprot:TRINITY_DN68263_c0_g1_i1.p1 TRINITY_DN68263_c0_g1~~TRINITY_DN68263_c0_g1_i1.p1  ORF type:complete len:227 (+),score=29.10 TRINITY_DN68263_c0_g1_i1:80-682(+)
MIGSFSCKSTVSFLFAAAFMSVPFVWLYAQSFWLRLLTCIVLLSSVGVWLRECARQRARQDAIAKAEAYAAAIARAEDAQATSAIRELGESLRGLAADATVRATAIGAAGGAVTVGAGGGMVGVGVGGVVGAACGVLPAIFTFGLSIPIGAAIGSSVGLGVGTAVGGTTGLVAGGVAGGAYAQREAIATIAGRGLRWRSR